MLKFIGSHRPEIEMRQILDKYSEKNTRKRHLITKLLLSFSKSLSLNLMVMDKNIDRKLG